jgi:hypothetical protein
MSRPTAVVKNQFVEVDVYYTEKVVGVRRTSAPFERVSDIESTIEVIARGLPVERRNGYALLIDMRDAPVRTDPSLEPAFARYRAEVERGFQRAVVVVATALGKIRSDRLGQTTQLQLAIVGSMDEAWEQLLRGS